MAKRKPALTIGIEEEYLIVDPATRDLADSQMEGLFADCETALEELVRPEFLKAQLEVGTRVCRSVKEAGKDLRRLRKTVAKMAARHGLAPIAASTHPFAHWQAQTHTDKERYNLLASDLQAVARRLLICGMHVHVGIESDDLRIELLNQVPYFLPHLMALSTSSPFWGGADTGLKSYRLCVWDELPRTGLPESFESFGEYQRHVGVLVDAGLIEDASMIWWDVRPSAKFPTLEMRITDMCTRVEDAITLAALYACVVRMLTRLRNSNQRWRSYARMLIDENRWRAARFGTDESLVDFGKGRLVAFRELMEELLELVAEDAEALDCADEIAGVHTILERGTSAHKQLADYAAAIAAGADPEEALKAVVDGLIAETVAGI